MREVNDMSTEKETISIIIPMYNAELFLHECISSVLAQSYENWELLLVNDGSTDGTSIICNEYTLRDKRIRYIEKENGGVSSARNTGIMQANGKYITFIDSDDIVKKEYCEKLIEKMKPAVGMVAYGMEYLCEDGRTVPLVHRIKDGEYSYDNFSKVVIDDGTMSGFSLHSSCAVLYRTEIVKKNKILFDEDIRYNEDGLFNVKYFLNCKQAIEICYSECLYEYRMVASSAVHQVDMESTSYVKNMQVIEEKLYALEKEFTDANICLQIDRRRVAILLEKIIFLAKSKRISPKKVREVICKEKKIEGFKCLNFHEMSWGKKLAGVAILFRLCLCITLMFRMRYSRYK